MEKSEENNNEVSLSFEEAVKIARERAVDNVVAPKLTGKKNFKVSFSSTTFFV